MGMEIEIFGDYLDSKQVEHVKNHKYNTTGYSWLDKKINPFWEMCAKALPYVRYITFISFKFNLGTNSK